MDARTTITEIRNIAKKNEQRDSAQKTRFITNDKIGVGECFRQGDLYIFRVAKNHPVGNEVIRNQIADGISIGARHVLNGKFRIYQGAQGPESLNPINARAGIGYVFDAEETTVLGHPEHDNYVFKFSGRWQVVHQLDLRTLGRIAD